jgi:polyisoprenoid-binding protein YceI
MRSGIRHIGRLSMIVGLLFPLVASAKLANPGNAEVSFTAMGPAGMKIVGTENEVKVADSGPAVVVTVPLAKLQTGISVRDQHMRKYLETDQFPTGELEVQRAALKIPRPGEVVTADATGTLKLHGKSKPTAFHYTVSREGTHLKVSGTTHVMMPDFGISVPSYLGITVKPDVEVSVRFEITEG